jgi:triosephosphate isomerase
VAGRIIGHIRHVVEDLVGTSAAIGLRILYGGSVTPENFPPFAAHPEVDGGLIGGASLRADSFIALTQQASDSGRAAN